MSRIFPSLRLLGVLTVVTPISAVGVIPALALPVGAIGDSRNHCTRPNTVGDTTVNVSFAGSTYPVLVYVPGSAPKHRPLPLVLNLHPSNGNGPSQMNISDLRVVADQEKFVIAAPNGNLPLPLQHPDPNGSWAWNVPGVPTTAGNFLRRPPETTSPSSAE